MSSVALLVFHNGKHIDYMDCPVGMIPVSGDTIVLRNTRIFRVAKRTIDFANNEVQLTVESL